jgi:hypothetical protein
MKESEHPSIELYMYSLNQEFPVKKGHATYLKRYSELKPSLRGELALHSSVESQIFQTGIGDVDVALPSDWSVQWLENQWIENHTKAAGMGVREDFDPLRNVIIREEDFGGIVFEPNSDRVYKVNRAGLELLRQVQEQAKSGHRFGDMRFDGFGEDQIAAFGSAMKAAGLMP